VNHVVVGDTVLAALASMSTHEAGYEHRAAIVNTC